MTLKHTPAPWVYDQKRTNVLAEGRELLVANVRGWGNLQKRSDGAEIMDANGRLIAAAPELYEALQSAIYRLEDMLMDDDGQAWKEARKALPRMKAILKKAQGEE